MTETQDTRPVICPSCCVEYQTPRQYFKGVEMFAKARPLCPACSAAVERQLAARGAEHRWGAIYANRCPKRYQSAKESRVHEGWTAVMNWNGDPAGGVGLVGPQESGKSCAIAIIVDRLKLPFRWWTGAEARKWMIDTAKDLRTTSLRDGTEAALLVIDDFAKTTFTQFFAQGILDILDSRFRAGLPTFWSSHLDYERLHNKIAHEAGHDSTLAQSILRRLYSDSNVAIRL